MDGIILKNKPLVEAIFEIRWQLQPVKPGNPHHHVLVGRFYDKFRAKYPFYEQLDAAAFPDEMAKHVVQYRFRSEGEVPWPLVQVGLGIMTLNDTRGYTWDGFEPRIEEMLDVLFQCHPHADDLKVSELWLRYLDGMDFDFQNVSVIDFLKKDLKIGIDIDQGLFKNTGMQSLPSGLDLRFSFPSTKPSGTFHSRFVRGKLRDNDALIMETMVQSEAGNVPNRKDGIIAWAQEAHSLAHEWFIRIIKGELRQRFE